MGMEAMLFLIFCRLCLCQAAVCDSGVQHQREAVSQSRDGRASVWFCVLPEEDGSRRGETLPRPGNNNQNDYYLFQQMKIKFTVPFFEGLYQRNLKAFVSACLFADLQVILTEVYPTGFHRSFFDEDDLTCIAENDVIYAFQAPPLYIRGGSARISGSSGTMEGN